MNVQIRAGDVPDLIKKTAKEIAGTFYDMNRTDQFRAEAGSQDHFVKRHWKSHVGVAIECLGGVLGLPGTPDDQKETIHAAILEFHERATRHKPKGLSLRNWQ
jgi:hypothetical protein